MLPQVCSVLVWSVSNAPGGTDRGRGIGDSPSTHAKLADIQKALATMRGHTSFLCTRTLDLIRYLHRITSENKETKTNMFVLEDETERGLDYKGNPTEGCQSQ